MKTKFKVGQIVQEDCGCRLKILKVGTKYYTCIHLEKPILSMEYDTKTKKLKKVKPENFSFQIEIKMLDARAILIKCTHEWRIQFTRNNKVYDKCGECGKERISPKPKILKSEKKK